jgi:aryl carrier-like protein
MNESNQITKAPLTLERMRAEIAEILHEDPAEIGDNDSLIDLGLDSIRAMILLQRWSDEGAPLNFAEFGERPELGYWWELIKKSR